MTSERPWTAADSTALYGFERWGEGYFGISQDGLAEVRLPLEDGAAVAVPLIDIVDAIGEASDLHTPLLLRFPHILEDRTRRLGKAFRKACRELAYEGDYRLVYPIKVNQDRHLAEAMAAAASPLGFGFEAGSKPELLAVLGVCAAFPDMPIVCNGFKDFEYLRTAMCAAKLGRPVIPVIEKFSELEALLEIAEELGVEPTIGVRAKLQTRGVGRWEDSAGKRSKFGLSLPEIVELLDRLTELGKLGSLQLLHCHIGSQVFDLNSVRHAVTELARVYVEMVALGAGLKMIDVGGGLGVDYDGSLSREPWSINYHLDEYASSVVQRIGRVCDEAGVEHPTILSESGRAVSAHHSVLIFEAVGISSVHLEALDEHLVTLERRRESTEQGLQPIHDLSAALVRARSGSRSLALRDAREALDEAQTMFQVATMDLKARAFAEELYWAVLNAVRAVDRERGSRGPRAAELKAAMADTVFCNFSVFQSLPDSRAIDQVFPIAPIHHLDERPTRRAILADLTCDSDGRIDRFIGPEGQSRRTLRVHSGVGERYLLAAFLTGAYQDILGDLHNLYGDTNAAFVRLDADGTWRTEVSIPGNNVREVLAYMQHDADELAQRLEALADRAAEEGKVSAEEAAAITDYFRAGFDGYTYLEEGE